MKAIIPLAGKGTRLRPLTYHTPKPLLKVGGRPILSYLLDDVMALGVEEMVFVVGYLQDVLRDFIASEYPQLACPRTRPESSGRRRWRTTSDSV
jgi:glucose-1-phosphate thymidylyltransferase